LPFFRHKIAQKLPCGQRLAAIFGRCFGEAYRVAEG